MDLTKILHRSIQIYLVTFVQKKTDYLRSLIYGSDQVSEQINSDLSGNIRTDYLRSLFIDLTKILHRSIQIYLVIFVQKKADYLRSLFMDLTKILNR